VRAATAPRRGGQQHPQGLVVPTAAGSGQVVTAQRLARCSYRIQRVAFARAAGGSSWPVDLDHPFAGLAWLPQCGSIRRLDPRPPAPAEPIAIPHLSRSDEQRRRGVFVHVKPTVRCYTKSALGHRPVPPRPRPVRLRLCRRRVKADPSASTNSRITDGSRRTAVRSIRNCRGAVAGHLTHDEER
jgi:hypothetical protein